MSVTASKTKSPSVSTAFTAEAPENPALCQHPFFHTFPILLPDRTPTCCPTLAKPGLVLTADNFFSYVPVVHIGSTYSRLLVCQCPWVVQLRQMLYQMKFLPLVWTRSIPVGEYKSFVGDFLCFGRDEKIISQSPIVGRMRPIQKPCSLAECSLSC